MIQLLILVIYCAVQESVAVFPITQTWIWGDGLPRINKDYIEGEEEEFKLISDYTEHGFIQLEFEPDLGALSIKLVKRPPSEYYPSSEPFCSKMLPTTIAEFIEANHVTDISSISVVVKAHPYFAACKCYMRTLISMGLNRVGEGSGVVVDSSKIDEYCDWRPVTITGRPTLNGSYGSSPTTVSLDDHIKLHTTVSLVI